MPNATRLKEPINQIKNELKAGLERIAPKSQFQESSNICWDCRTLQNGKLLESRENAQLEQSSEDHVAVGTRLTPSSMPMRLYMISVLTI